MTDTPRRRARRQSRPPVLVAALVLGAAVGLCLLPLVPVFGPRAAITAITGGVLLGAATAATAARRRWSGVITCGVVLGVYLLAGAAIAVPTMAWGRVVPTPAAVLALLAGAISVWKEVLTLDPQLGAAADVLVAPYLLGLGGSAVAVSIAVRAPGARRTWAALVPAAVLGISLLLGTKQTVQPLAAGVVLVAVLLTWAAWRRGALAWRRVVAMVLMAVAVVGGGVAGGPVLADPSPRFVLRDEMVPPFDPRDHPSPLSAFRTFVKQWRDTPLLTVRGLPEGAAVRLATMDAFDGVVWNVAGSEQAEGSGSFRRVGETISTSVTGISARVQFEVLDLPMVWLPTVGYTERFSFTGADADLAPKLRYNDATGTAVLTDGVPAGTTWSADVVVPEVPEEGALDGAGVGTVRLPEPTGVPEAVPLFAGQIAGTASSPLLIARSLEAGLANGWFSHGVSEADYPSLSGHGADRVTTLLTGKLMVGDGEQYASAMALMAREMGLPSRVVLGFIPAEGAGDEIVITGDDVQAWVEIQFAGHGWVAFNPTPDESRTPREDTPEDPVAEQPQVRQPPQPPPDPVVPPEDDTEQPQTREHAEDPIPVDRWGTVIMVAASAGVPVILLVTPLVVIALLKRRRRLRRRTSGDPVTRVVGGWDELLDEARDLRRRVPVTATRRETAVHLAEVFPRRSSRRPPVAGTVAAAVAGTVAGLAASADAAVFGPGQPPAEHVDLYWQQVEVARAAMRAAIPRRQRLRSHWATSSLRSRRAGRRRAARAGR